MDNNENKELMLGNEDCSKCCAVCTHFDPRTHFCRLNPPIPMVFYVYEGNARKQNVSSKFPTIVLPSKDVCSHFKHVNMITEN